MRRLNCLQAMHGFALEVGGQFCGKKAVLCKQGSLTNLYLIFLYVVELFSLNLTCFMSIFNHTGRMHITVATLWIRRYQACGDTARPTPSGFLLCDF